MPEQQLRWQLAPAGAAEAVQSSPSRAQLAPASLLLHLPQTGSATRQATRAVMTSSALMCLASASARATSQQPGAVRRGRRGRSRAVLQTPASCARLCPDRSTHTMDPRRVPVLPPALPMAVCVRRVTCGPKAFTCRQRCMELGINPTDALELPAPASCPYERECYAVLRPPCCQAGSHAHVCAIASTRLDNRMCCCCCSVAGWLAQSRTTRSTTWQASSSTPPAGLWMWPRSAHGQAACGSRSPASYTSMVSSTRRHQSAHTCEGAAAC
jgi:hypothetical protein